MCENRNGIRVKIRNKVRRIDECLTPLIQEINRNSNLKTLSCCCGHNKYHKTIFIQNANQQIYEYFTKILIFPEKRKYLNFYILDKQTKLYFNPVIESLYQRKNPIDRNTFNIENSHNNIRI